MGACPDGYRQVTDEATCSAATTSLSGGQFIPEENSSDPPGCFEYTWDGVSQFYFNANLQAVPAGGHSTDRYPICMLQEFTSFHGKWKWIGQGVESSTLTSTISWSDETSSGTSSSFEWGLEEGVEAEVTICVPDGATGCLPLTIAMSASGSQTWSDSVAQSVSHMSGGEQSYSCDSVSCSHGNLWQWEIVGETTPEFNTGDQTNRQCSFACLPNSISIEETPKCPAGYCGSLDCQCCNSNLWAQEQDRSSVPLCANPTHALSTSGGSTCEGCN